MAASLGREPDGSGACGKPEDYLAATRRLLGVPPGALARAPRDAEALAGDLCRRSASDAVVVLEDGSWQGARHAWLPLALPLARHLPVFVIQPDLDDEDLEDGDLVEECTCVSSIRVLHVHQRHGRLQRAVINCALDRLGVRRAIFLTDHLGFHRYLATRFTALSVFLVPGPPAKESSGEHPRVPDERLRRILEHADLLVTGSEEDLRNLERHHACAGRSVTSPPYASVTDLHPPEASVRLLGNFEEGRPDRVFVPGPLEELVDPMALEEVTALLPDWEFLVNWTRPDPSLDWDGLLSRPNLQFLGDIPLHEAKWHAYNAQVALLPLAAEASVVEARASILAMWACGLPVVTSSRCGLNCRAGVLEHSATPVDLARACRVAAATRLRPEALSERLALSRIVEPCSPSTTVLEAMLSIVEGAADESRRRLPPLNVLVAHGSPEEIPSTHAMYLQNIRQYSRHNVVYAQMTVEAIVPIDLSVFDAIVVSASPSFTPHSSSREFIQALREYGGYKLLVGADSVGGFGPVHAWTEETGFHAAFSGEAPPPGVAIPGVEIVGTGRPCEPAHLRNLVATLDAHLESRIRARARRHPIQGVVGYHDPHDGLVRWSTPSYCPGSPTTEMFTSPAASRGQSHGKGHPDAIDRVQQRPDATARSVKQGGF